MQLTEKAKPESWVWTASKIGLAILLIGIVFSQTKLQNLLDLRSHISWFWVCVYFGLYISLTAFKSYQYKKMLDLPIPYLRMVSIVVLQNGLSNIVANSAGIFSYLMMLRAEQGVKVSRAALVFIVTKTGDLFAIWTALLISSVILWYQIESLHLITILLLVLIGLSLLVFYIAVFTGRHFAELAITWLQIMNPDRFKIIQRGADFFKSLLDLDHSEIKRMVFTGATLSFFYFFLTFLWSYSQIKMFSVSLDVFPFLLITAILQLVSIIPVTILGGLGVNEASSMIVFPVFGIDPVPFAAILIGMRIMFYFVNLVMLLYLPLYAFFNKNKS